MARFDPSRSVLAGMNATVLTAQLAAMQQTYLDLMSGAKGESFSYTQGDGARSVTYTRSNAAALLQAIKLLQAQLGIIEHPRRARRVMFR